MPQHDWFAQFETADDDPFATYADETAQPEPSTISPITEDEPTTFRGGFLRSLNQQAKEAFLQNPMLEAAAHPQSFSDFASLAVPSGMPRILSRGAEMATRYGSQLKEAVQTAPRARNVPMAILRTLGREAFDPMPVAQRKFQQMPLAQQMEYLPQTGQMPMGRSGGPPLPRPQPAIRPQPMHAPAQRRTLSPGQEAGVTAGEQLSDIIHGPGASPQLQPSGHGLMPAVKPKLSAPEVAAKLREQYGSAQAGRYLYGPPQKGAQAGSAVKSAAARQAAIKRLAPGESTLPQAARRQIDRELGASTPEEAFGYAQRAPNARAQQYFGERLKGVLRDPKMQAALTLSPAMLRQAYLDQMVGDVRYQ